MSLTNVLYSVCMPKPFTKPYHRLRAKISCSLVQESASKPQFIASQHMHQMLSWHSTALPPIYQLWLRVLVQKNVVLGLKLGLFLPVITLSS